MRPRICGSVLIACLATWISVRADEPREKSAKLIMRDKLQATNAVLEGLVTEDYKAIRSGAVRLQGVLKHRSWHVLATPEYMQFSEEMKRHSQRLADTADARDIDAASLAYVQLTLTCINCHKHVRDVKIAEFHLPSNTVISSAFPTPEN